VWRLAWVDPESPYMMVRKWQNVKDGYGESGGSVLQIGYPRLLGSLAGRLVSFIMGLATHGKQALIGLWRLGSIEHGPDIAQEETMGQIELRHLPH
jgi:hypothetical protein